MSDNKERLKYGIEYKEIAEYLMRKHHIHDGIWGLYVDFKFSAVNTRDQTGEILPATVSAMSELGITPYPEESSLAFDAAKLNPSAPMKRKPKK